MRRRMIDRKKLRGLLESLPEEMLDLPCPFLSRCGSRSKACKLQDLEHCSPVVKIFSGRCKYCGRESSILYEVNRWIGGACPSCFRWRVIDGILRILTPKIPSIDPGLIEMIEKLTSLFIPDTDT